MRMETAASDSDRIVLALQTISASLEEEQPICAGAVSSVIIGSQLYQLADAKSLRHATDYP